MTKEVQDSESQFIPGAGAYSDKFLGVVQQRCNAAGLGITLGPAKRSRKDPSIVMRGTMTFGSAFKGKRPYILEVFADAAGANLNVGYQLVTEEVGGIIGNTEFGRMANRTQTRIHNDPNTQRQLSGILQGFYQMVFIPTVQDLVNALSTSRSSEGFLGA